VVSLWKGKGGYKKPGKETARAAEKGKKSEGMELRIFYQPHTRRKENFLPLKKKMGKARNHGGGKRCGEE